MAKKSLLQSIRDKELETNVTLDTARREAAEVVESAKKEAAGIIAEAEQEAARASEEHVRREMERISREAEETKRTEMERAEQAAATGRSRIPLAVEKITKAVIPE
jgi:vacuolar-type H+-ATPase subunit H